MKVKEILKMSAEMAGEAQTALYFERKGVDDLALCEENAHLLLRCYNLITEELALEYLPLKKEEILTAKDGKIEFSRFTFKPLRILGVHTKNGQKVPYRLVNDYLELPNGEFKVEYNYRVEPSDEDDEVLYNDTVIGAYALAYGILSQYLLEKGRVSESNIYQEKYLSAIKARIAEKRKLKLPARRWI